MGLSHAYNTLLPLDDAKSFIRQAFEMGVNHFDTSSMYGLGENERLLGEAFAGCRDKVFIASKGGLTTIDASGKEERGINNNPENIRRSCDKSLQRLKTDYIDLYYLHRWDKKTPIEECVATLAELVKQGKVRAIGLSEVSAQTLRRACAVHPVAAIQSEYSLWTRDPEDGLLDTCKELGVRFVAFSPLARGFFGGKVFRPDPFANGDIRLGMPRFCGDNFEKNKQLLPAFYALAEEAGCTTAQVALAWLLHHRPHEVSVIPGATKMSHLKDNLGAQSIRLSADVIQKLEKLINKDTVSGDRYNEKTFTEIDR